MFLDPAVPLFEATGITLSPTCQESARCIQQSSQGVGLPAGRICHQAAAARQGTCPLKRLKMKHHPGLHDGEVMVVAEHLPRRRVRR